MQVFTKVPEATHFHFRQPGIGSPKVSWAFGALDRLGAWPNGAEQPRRAERSRAEPSRAESSFGPAGPTRLRPRKASWRRSKERESGEAEPFVWSACARGLSVASGSAVRAWPGCLCARVRCLLQWGGRGLLLLRFAALCLQLYGSWFLRRSG